MARPKMPQVMQISRLRIAMTSFAWAIVVGAIIAVGVKLTGSVFPDIGPLGGLRAVVEPQRLREQILGEGNEALAVSPSARRAAIDKVEAQLAYVLRLAPTDGALWSLDARLAAAGGTKDQDLAELLKMSYFTAPNDLSLMPTRLDVAVRTRALSDPVLEVLAAGDMRALLLKRPELSGRLIESFKAGSEPGKAFMKRTSDGIDLQFAARLNAAR